jgi:hypothetical protein
MLVNVTARIREDSNLAANRPAPDRPIDVRRPRPANEMMTFWEDVKSGFWVWLVIIAVAIAVLCHYADWSVFERSDHPSLERKQRP